MEEFDPDSLNREEATGKLKTALDVLNLEKHRQFAINPQAGWDPNGSASVLSLIMEEIQNPQLKQRLKYDRNRIVALIHHPAMTFMDQENPGRFMYYRWSSFNFLFFAQSGPEALLILEKCAHVLEVDIQVALLKDALKNVPPRKLNDENVNYVARIIEIFFERSAEHLDKGTIIHTFQRCRYLSGIIDVDSILYVRIWHKLHSHFPKTYLTKISTQHGSKYAADLCEQLYYHGSLPKCVNFIDSSEDFIMAYFILERNPFISGNGQKTEAVGSFLASLGIKNMGKLFINANFMEQFSRACKEMDLKGSWEAWRSIKTIVIEMCHYWRENRGDLLFHTLQGIMRHLKKWDTDSIEFTFQMNEAAGRDIVKLSNRDLNDISYELKSNANCYPAVLLYYKYMYPTSSQERDSILGKLCYGQSPYEEDKILSFEAAKELSLMFRLTTDDEKFTFQGLFNGNSEKLFGGIVWEWKSFPNLLKLITATEIALIHEYGNELKANKNNRRFFCDVKGSMFFIHCQDYSLSFLLEILDVAKGSRYFAGFEFQSEELSRGRRVHSLINEEELQSFKAGFRGEILESFRKYGQEKNNEICEYITLLVDMFCISMEVTEYDTAYKNLFNYFYVPVVKALLLFSPLQAIRLIVALCRSDLKINLKAAYNNKSDLQKNWSHHQEEQSNTEREEYFKTFPLTVPDLIKKTDHSDQSSDLEFLMLTDYVAAVVNYRELFDKKEVIDYYVIHKYYSKIGSQNLTRHKWEIMKEEDAQQLLLSP